VIALYQSRHGSRNRLSAEEISVISEKISRDYTPKYANGMPKNGSEIKFSTKELLAISDEISREFADYSPKYVPQSICVLMPVDPNHLHAYWYLDKKQQETVNRKDAANALVLRVFSGQDKDINLISSTQYFDVICDNSMSQQTISLPQTPPIECNYSVAIGQCQDNEFVAFAFSDMTYLPREAGVPFGSQKQKPENAVISHFLKQNFSGKGKIPI